MSCERARGIDIAAFLVAPRAREYQEFREHYPGCPECSAKIAGWAQLERALPEGMAAASHPTDELLLAYGRAPESLPQEQREELAQHVGGCAPCRDALAVAAGPDLAGFSTRSSGRTAQSAASSGPLSTGLAERLRAVFGSPATSWGALLAAAVLLAFGVPWLLRDDAPPPVPLARDDVPLRSEPALEMPRAPEPAADGLADAKPEPPAEPEPIEAPRQPVPEAVAKTLPPEPPPAVEPPARTGALVNSLGPRPILLTPRPGIPARRVAAGTRGVGAAQPQPLALTPESVGLTLESQPNLYWFLLTASPTSVRIDVSDTDAMQTLHSVTLRAPLRAGMHVLKLSENGIRLEPDRHYEWWLTPLGTDAPASGGLLARVTPDAELRAALAAAEPAERLRLLAAAGIWHDALDLLSRSIAARPSDAELRRARAGLFEQQGLLTAAAWDRAAR
jgi:hypothetical protein